MIILRSGINFNKIFECLIEANSDITEQELVEYALRIIKNPDKNKTLDLMEFIRSKAGVLFNSYQEFYLDIFLEMANFVSYVIEFFQHNNLYVENELKYNYITILPSTDVIFSVKNVRTFKILCD